MFWAIWDREELKVKVFFGRSVPHFLCWSGDPKQSCRRVLMNNHVSCPIFHMAYPDGVYDPKTAVTGKYFTTHKPRLKKDHLFKSSARDSRKTR